MNEKRYEVRRTGTGEFIGVVMGRSLTHANTKALQLYRRHVYAVSPTNPLGQTTQSRVAVA